jgi:hypothetical protein
MNDIFGAMRHHVQTEYGFLVFLIALLAFMSVYPMTDILLSDSRSSKSLRL